MRTPQRVILAFIALSVVFAAGCGQFFRAPSSSGGSSSEFLFVANANNGAQGSVSSFSINTSSGALTANGSAVNAGIDTSVLAIDPQNRFLFAGNNSGGISVFSISNGTLTAVSGSPFAPGTTPTAIAVHPNGNSIYVEDQASATLSAFSVSSAGALTAITGSASNSITDVGDSMAVNSAGTRLYAPIGTAGLATVPINSDGSLGTASITQPPTGQKLTSVALLSTRNLYATNGNTGVFAYTLDSNGFPATILNSGNAFAAGNNTSQVKIEPSGRFLLVVNTNSNSVSSFAILSDGSLTQVAGSPFSTGTGPADLAFDAGGKFVYVVNSQGSPGISIFALDASAIGKLNGAGSASTGTNPLAAIGTH